MLRCISPDCINYESGANQGRCNTCVNSSDDLPPHLPSYPPRNKPHDDESSMLPGLTINPCVRKSIPEDKLDPKLVLMFVVKQKVPRNVFYTPRVYNTIDIVDYVKRVSEHLLQENMDHLKLSYHYMRIYSEKTGVAISSSNMHKLFLSAATVVYKYWVDDAMGNDIIADIGGVSLGVMNRMELQFLDDIQWSVGEKNIDRSFHQAVYAITSLNLIIP